MENSTQPVQQAPQKTSHKPSITGIVLAVLSLALSSLGYFFITAEPNTPASPTASDLENQVGQAVSDGTMSVLGTIFGMPLLVGGFVLGFLAVIFILVRLRKVRVMGAIFSIVAVLLVAWSYSIAINAFELIKAHPA